MTTFTYVLSFDPDSTAFKLNQLHSLIVSHRMIKSWYFAYRGTYLLKSDEALVNLTPSFRVFFDGAPFLLAFLMPEYTGGAFAQPIWDWVNADRVPAVGSAN